MSSFFGMVFSICLTFYIDFEGYLFIVACRLHAHTLAIDLHDFGIWTFKFDSTLGLSKIHEKQNSIDNRRNVK